MNEHTRLFSAQRLLGAGEAALLEEDEAGAHILFEQALDLARTEQDWKGEAESLLALANSALHHCAPREIV